MSHLVNNVWGVNQDGVASGLLFRKYMATFVKGMQNQLDGLLNFCSLNLMSVNEIKTKAMVIGNKSSYKPYIW